MSVDQATTALPTAPTVTVTAPAPIKAFSEDDGPSFKDVIDIINPLQHIPIINTIYRHLTGDEEGAVADVGGGALYAGPLGIIGSLVDLAVHAETGKTIGDNILSWLGLDDDDAPAEAAKTAEVQAQQQVQQQQAAATAPLPAIAAQTLTPLPARQDRRDGKDAPAKAGEFMEFGAAPGDEPVSLTPPVTAADAVDQDASRGPNRQGNYMVFGGESQAPSQSPAQPQQQASADTATVGRQGDFMVFGASAPSAATAARATAAYAAPMAPATASVTAQTPIAQAPAAKSVQVAQAAQVADAVANSVPPGGGPAALSPLPARTFAAPARRTQVTPAVLPMPTTGPSAVPGHFTPSQAVQAPMSQQDAGWFMNAMNAGLDKYAAAQKLADQSTTANASAAASAEASAQTFATVH